MTTRITTLKPNCGYNLAGISAVQVLDYEDFISFGFADGRLYDSCLIQSIQRAGPFADVQAAAAKYSGPISGKIIAHTLETFVDTIEAVYIAALHLASRRRYVVIFTGLNGRSYAFGYEAGAAVSYSGQTDGALGYIITFTAASVYPLFEVTADALISNVPTAKWLPDFNTGAYCEIKP